MQRWLVGQAVKTLASHAENMGSIPVRVTNEKRTLLVGVLFFVDVIPSGSTHPENLRFSGYGFAFAARRSASLFARRRASKYSPLAKFPYLFAARDIICANYTFCTDCKHHLLAWQYTDSGGMHQNVSYRSKFPYVPHKTHPQTAFPVRFCAAYHRLGFTAWKQYTRLDLLATRDIASRKTVTNCFSLALIQKSR